MMSVLANFYINLIRLQALKFYFMLLTFYSKSNLKINLSILLTHERFSVNIKISNIFQEAWMITDIHMQFSFKNLFSVPWWPWWFWRIRSLFWIRLCFHAKKGVTCTQWQCHVSRDVMNLFVSDVTTLMAVVCFTTSRGKSFGAFCIVF